MSWVELIKDKANILTLTSLVGGGVMKIVHQVAAQSEVILPIASLLLILSAIGYNIVKIFARLIELKNQNKE